MKRTIKIIRAIVIMGIMLLLGACTQIAAYAQEIDNTQTETGAQEAKTITEVLQVECVDIQSENFYNDFVDMRNASGFVGTNEGLQIYFCDGTGYYIDADMMYCNYYNLDAIAVTDNQHMIDMRTVIGFDIRLNGLQLYLNDGTGYWWER